MSLLFKLVCFRLKEFILRNAKFCLPTLRIRGPNQIRIVRKQFLDNANNKTLGNPISHVSWINKPIIIYTVIELLDAAETSQAQLT